MSVARKPRSYYDKYPETPVEILPFDPRVQELGRILEVELKSKLANWPVAINLFGSALLGIPGKHEAEVAVYIQDKEWLEVENYLQELYGEPVTKKEERIRFEVIRNDIELEIVMKRYGQQMVDSKLTEYLLTHPSLLREYEKLKYQYATSKREYLYQKAEFFSDILNGLGN